MKSILLGLFLLTITLQSQAYPLVPNPAWAQGSLCNKQNPDYQTDRYAQKIPYCKRNVEWELKQELYDLYKVPEKCRGQYTIDHIIPLSIGGDNTAKNLWPEHKNIKATRLYLEEEVFMAVRDNQMSQKDAIALILKTKKTPVQLKKGNSDCD
ncbi:MAG: HNH endonuclease signature motif containing protein [Bdellovibrionota bacterium]